MHTTLLSSHINAVIHPYCIYTKSVHKNVEAASLSLIITTCTDLPLLPHSFCSISGTCFTCSVSTASSTSSSCSVSTASSKAPVAKSIMPPPAPSSPPNITTILEKACHFITLIRLLKSTRLDNEIYIKLNDSSQSLTMFAPTDNAFGSLKKGILNSYSDQQKFQLIKFHLIPSFLSIPAFQTVSNPMNTEAGSNDQYPINITTVGNQVNISTGIVNTTISGTIYSDNQLAVYQVDKVLLPLYFFVTPSPSPAPTPSKPEKKAPSPSGSESVPTTDNAAITASSAMRVIHHALNAMIFAGFLIAALSLCI